MSAFRWTTQREEAAALVAADDLTDEQIAARFGISRQALQKWKTHPGFRARVDEHLLAVRDALKAEGIANRQNRIAALNDRWDKMLTVIRERGEDEAMAEIPGGTTGLLVHQVKAIGTGRNQTIIDEYVLDAALLREAREHEKQAAQETGQWEDKLRLDGEMLIREYVGVDVDDV